MSIGNESLALVVAAFAVFSAHALDFPTGSAPVVTNQGSEVATYVATGNLTYEKLAVCGGGKTVFDLSDGPYTATLTGTGDYVMGVYDADTDLTLLGGTWSFTGAKPFFNSNAGVRRQRWKVTLDGATMSGLNTFYLARDNDSYASVVLTNGASLAAGTFTVTGYGGNAAHNSLIINTGSTFTGNFVTDGGNGVEDIDALVLVDGTGSKFVGGGTLGNGHRNCRLEVRNGAAFGSSSASLSVAAGQNSADCHVFVTNNASLTLASLTLGKYAKYGSNPATHDNSVLIADGATATVTEVLYVGSGYNSTGSSNNVVEVRQAALTVSGSGSNKGILMNGRDCVDNALKIVGASASLDTAGWKSLSDSGSRNLLLVDGGTWTCRTGFGLGNGTNNEMRVINGGKADISGEFMIGSGDLTRSYHGNVLTVGAEASVQASTVYMTADSTALVVSNGTLKATAENTSSTYWALSSAMFGYTRSGSGYDYLATNMVITLQGDKPLITSPVGRIVFERNLVVNVEIPEDGYAAGHVPIVGKLVSFDNGGVANTLIVPEVTKFRKKLRGKTSLTIVRATESLAAGDVVARSNALAPEGCRFSVVGNDIVLTVKPDLGMLLLMK